MNCEYEKCTICVKSYWKRIFMALVLTNIVVGRIIGLQLFLKTRGVSSGT